MDPNDVNALLSKFEIFAGRIDRGFDHIERNFESVVQRLEGFDERIRQLEIYGSVDQRKRLDELILRLAEIEKKAGLIEATAAAEKVKTRMLIGGASIVTTVFGAAVVKLLASAL